MSRSWDEVAESLAEAISEFENGTVLKLVGADQPDGRYLQMWQTPEAVAVEISSSNVLGTELGISEQVERHIGELGWTAPQGRDNWRTILPWPASAEDYRMLARNVVAVWRDVFGLDSPDLVRYRGFISTTHERLVLPDVGLQAVG